MTSHGLRSCRETRLFKIGPFDTPSIRVFTGSEVPFLPVKVSKNDAVPRPQSQRWLSTNFYLSPFSSYSRVRLGARPGCMSEGFDRRGKRMNKVREAICWQSGLGRGACRILRARCGQSSTDGVLEEQAMRCLTQGGKRASSHPNRDCRRNPAGDLKKDRGV